MRRWIPACLTRRAAPLGQGAPEIFLGNSLPFFLLRYYHREIDTRNFFLGYINEGSWDSFHEFYRILITRVNNMRLRGTC